MEDPNPHKRRKRSHSHLEHPPRPQPFAPSSSRDPSSFRTIDRYFSPSPTTRTRPTPQTLQPDHSPLFLPRLPPENTHDRRMPSLVHRQPSPVRSRMVPPPQAEVIDLTEDTPRQPGRAAERTFHNAGASGRLGTASRPPRFGTRSIILVRDSPTPGGGDDDIQFLSSRRLPDPIAYRRSRQPPPPPRQEGNAGQLEEDGLTITGSRSLRNDNLSAVNAASLFGTHTHLNTIMDGLSTMASGISGGLMFTSWLPRASTSTNFTPPTQMNFEIIGFNLGSSHSDNDTPAPPTVIDPPPPAPEGFTRTPKEDESYVCPNCGDELCEGDSDLKKQIWVVKDCGHVYCGECTQYRHVSKQKNIPPSISARIKPFKKCVVDGCTTNTTTRTKMVQLFF